ncbi:hypothetical protein AB0M02_14815 [Actinoplanes sp. NPDC051861]
MQTLIADFAPTVVAGLAGILGVYAAEGILERLRQSGRCPRRWR